MKEKLQEFGKKAKRFLLTSANAIALFFNHPMVELGYTIAGNILAWMVGGPILGGVVTSLTIIKVARKAAQIYRSNSLDKRLQYLQELKIIRQEQAELQASYTKYQGSDYERTPLKHQKLRASGELAKTIATEAPPIIIEAISTHGVSIVGRLISLVKDLYPTVAGNLGRQNIVSSRYTTVQENDQKRAEIIRLATELNVPEYNRNTEELRKFVASQYNSLMINAMAHNQSIELKREEMSFNTPHSRLTSALTATRTSILGTQNEYSPKQLINTIAENHDTAVDQTHKTLHTPQNQQILSTIKAANVNAASPGAPPPTPINREKNSAQLTSQR